MASRQKSGVLMSYKLLFLHQSELVILEVDLKTLVVRGFFLGGGNYMSRLMTHLEDRGGDV